jgi:hypothetical protein
VPAAWLESMGRSAGAHIALPRAFARQVQSRCHFRRFARCSFSRAARLLRPAFCASSLRRWISVLSLLIAASDVDRPGPGLFGSTNGVRSSLRARGIWPRMQLGAGVVVARRAADVGKHWTLTPRAVRHGRLGHPRRTPQLLAGRTPVVSRTRWILRAAFARVIHALLPASGRSMTFARPSVTFDANCPSRKNASTMMSGSRCACESNATTVRPVTCSTVCV